MLLMLITVTILSILLYTLLLQQEGVFNALCCRFVPNTRRGGFHFSREMNRKTIPGDPQDSHHRSSSAAASACPAARPRLE